MITDEPTPEVAAAGHDRSPIFLAEDIIDSWLKPDGKSNEELYEILNSREPVYYSNKWVEAA